MNNIKAVTADPLQVPRAPFKRQLQRKFEILMGHTQLQASAHFNSGPRALTYFVKKYNLNRYAEPQNVFYPLLVKEANLLVQSEEMMSARLTSDTVIIHAWRTTFKNAGFLKEIPSANTYIGKACKYYEIKS